MDNFPLKKETYQIIGVCMEVQRTPGYGFSEAVYKDAVEMEFGTNKILHRREEEL
jgi:GxxExxY protein